MRQFFYRLVFAITAPLLCVVLLVSLPLSPFYWVVCGGNIFDDIEYWLDRWASKPYSGWPK